MSAARDLIDAFDKMMDAVLSYELKGGSSDVCFSILDAEGMAEASKANAIVNGLNRLAQEANKVASMRRDQVLNQPVTAAMLAQVVRDLTEARKAGGQ